MSTQIKPKRSSGDAEENILRFLQACTTLGVKKVVDELGWEREIMLNRSKTMKQNQIREYTSITSPYLQVETMVHVIF